MVANQGEPMRLWGFDYPVVIDLDTASIINSTIPALYNHLDNLDAIVGQVDTLTIARDGVSPSLIADGYFTPSGRPHDIAADVIARADAGFIWQASIGGNPEALDRIEAGATGTANGGRVYPGPCLIARKTRFREISFVILGADPTTSVSAKFIKGSNMTFEEWLVSMGFDADAQSALSDVQRANLQLVYDEEYGEEEEEEAESETESDPNANANPLTDDPNAPTNAAARPPVVRGSAGGNRRTPNPVASHRASIAAEMRRIEQVGLICSRFGNPTIEVGRQNNRHRVSLQSHAVANGWNVTQVELEAMRSSRPDGVHSATYANGSQSDGLRVIAAALAQAGRMDRAELERSFDAQTLQAAHNEYRGRIGLKQLLYAAASANGYHGNPHDFSNAAIGEILRAAFNGPMVRASGFDTMSLGGILSNNMNKFLLQGFLSVEDTWSRIGAKRAVNDFKQITSYRLAGAFQFDKVGPTGELKHDAASEIGYTNQISTYGKMAAITRQDIINDDLGALTVLPQRIGRGAALKLNDIFWSTFWSTVTGAAVNGVNVGSTYFSTAKKNKFSGAGSALSRDGLIAAETGFRNQVDPDGKPLGVKPSILLVGPSNARVAAELMNSGFYVVGGASSASQLPSTNTFQGTFRPESSAYIENASYGNSTKGWFLLADPVDLAFIEVAFLNGVESPTVETADADFNTLGIQMRGYFDFGVSPQEYRAANYSVGA